MIMILDVDVTAERRHYNTHRPQGDTTTLGPKGPVKLKNPWARKGPSILRTFSRNPSTQPAAKAVPLFYNLKTAAQRPPQPSGQGARQT